ncbi:MULTISPECIES: hypothetical protein [Lacrimispora]|uniref:hypothetical protein n=1 Tax=Lacrimispora TaxID=2719231 RepID=UPI000BE22B50|nr:hypothetical protein [Lacrimispora amygdalina]MDK2967792.1 hypothetical protein [Lacrimispora sp.]
MKFNQISKEKLEAHLLDYMLKHPELTPDVPAPPTDEFQKIMAELDKRGTKTIVRRQLIILHFCNFIIYCIHKPVLIIRNKFIKNT